MSNVALPAWLERAVERWKAVPGTPSLLFGVILPLGTIAFELITRMCAEALFDPLPTLFHALLVTLVPAANLLVWLSFRKPLLRPQWLAFGNGVAIGIAGFYSLLFLPLLPIAAIAILYFGIGALPWAPVFALLAAIGLYRRLRRVAAQEQRPHRMWPGLLCGILALIALDLPATLTRIGVRMATAETPAEQVRGLRMLRAVGSDDVLLRLCYVRTGRATDLLGFVFDMHSVMPEQVRTVYYRVTGTPFNAHSMPRNVQWRGRMFRDDFDFDQGSDDVGGQVYGLHLLSSRIDGSLDAQAALGYLEWTLVLKNDTSGQQEGRAQIALPRGAVVSRLTLWIDGEEREAAFAARGKVRQAYRNVVRQRRDPVLVTTAGADRIALQMFPVPAQGEMKVRIGMTVPLQLESFREGTLRLPSFQERNFGVDAALRHSVWIESKAALRSEGVDSQPVAAGNALRLQIPDSELGRGRSTVTAARTAGEVAWTRDSLDGSHVIRQTLQAVTTTAPRRIVMVVDGSAAMKRTAAQLAESVAHLPPQPELFLVVAEDLQPADDVPRASVADSASLLRSYEYVGGKDNTAALARGLDKAMQVPDSVLVWIHGPQPVLLQTSEAVEQRLARGGSSVRWYDVQTAPGPNLIAQHVEDLIQLRALSMADLDRLFASWQPGGRQFVAVRERIDSSQVLPPDAETSPHLARLWASDEVGRLLYAAHPARDAAIDVAWHYQLVTAVSGAVVLETQQQYDAAGLTPVPEGTVPTIPEPEEWALMVVVAVLLGYACWRHRATRIHAAS
ncbi:MAG TPA: VIT domain-containing protein [Povalibacter sp.]|nr:VIT domain-containing protein [Povalibacter sp.]